MIPLPPLVPFPVFLYAETHYRFRYFLSFLKKREPEIVVDTPHRLEPKHRLPILILVKDADQYPTKLISAQIEIRSEGSPTRTEVRSLNVQVTKERFWSRVLYVDVHGVHGWIEVNVHISYECSGKTRSCRNDNYRTANHAPLRVYVAENPLPTFPGLYYGDAHTHSQYTDDQVEFGAPLAPSVELSRAMGLSFFAATDHSYDLDDRPGDYLHNDPTRSKWHAFQAEVDTLNTADRTFRIIRGIEVSCRNQEGENVHLLVLGAREFISGAGDSAERWLHTRSEYSVTEVLSSLSSDQAAFAAHPLEPVPQLQRILLRRGSWALHDFDTEGLAGLQFMNGVKSRGFRNGYRVWRKLLLEGKRVFGLAGTDAHGNFNRFRQLGIPFVTVVDRNVHLFGTMRVGAYLQGKISERGLVQALRDGKFFLTDGPALHFHAETTDGGSGEMGSIMHGTFFRLHVQARSTPEFGHMSHIRVFLGVIGSNQEKTLYASGPSATLYDFSEHIDVAIQSPSFIMVEVTTRVSESAPVRSHIAISNPIWLLP